MISANPVYVVVASGAVMVNSVVDADNAGSVEFPTTISGVFPYAIGNVIS